MIATLTNHVSRGVTNIENTSIKNMWYGANFNMPVKNYMTWTDWGSIVRYSGCWTYDTETLNYDLTGFVPGYEICNGCAIFDFDNDGASTYNIDTYLYVRWANPDLSDIYWITNGYHFTYALLAGDWAEIWRGGNIGVAGWEVHTDDTYHFRASAVGTPTIAPVDSSVVITNCPSTTQLGSDKMGYIWVEGNNLCYINADEWKHTIVGVDNGSAPGVSKAGYWWLETNVLHWVGANGHDYYIPWAVKQVASFYSNGATGEKYAGTSNYGKIWVDDEYGFTHIAYIASDGYKYLCGAGANPLP